MAANAKVAEKSVPVTESTITAQEATNQVNTKVKSLEAKRKELAAQYKAEDKVIVKGSPMYQPYFGRNMPISLNGIIIHVPLDGKTYSIPTSFAEVFNSRLMSVDEDIALKRRLSNVQENLESYAGEKDLISRA